MEPSERPRIQLQLSIADKIVEVLAILLLLFFWIYTLKQYSNLPDIIPTHFSGDGTVDGYGVKQTMFIMLFIATGLFVMLTVFSRYPHKFNYMTVITEANALTQYTLSTRMLRVMKLSVTLVFLALDFKTIETAHGHADSLGGWFMLLIMGLIFVPLFYFLIQFSKNS
ncbi:DUF1648 domain-containing protein [Flavobacterium sp. XGLA_31]|uniref:DUF1648 domain-containing protein n=1 Tax=Flavobacterium sp. XGLA_31 TaxID=3447666 RepID=UPI003F3DD489